MSWKKHFRIVKPNPQSATQMPPTDTNKFGGGTSTNSNFSSYLPVVYAGHPNRIQRYYQFDDMDRDSDINAALDTIADFSTLSEEHADEPFELKYNGEPNESEVKILKMMMAKWIKLNNFRAKLWYMFRDTLKNGDAFFLRDPETYEWLWLDHFMVEMVKIDDTQGKKPDEYLIRGLDYNRQTKFATKQADPNQYRTPYGTSNVGASRVSATGASSAPAAFSLAGTSADPRQRHMLGPFSQDVSVIDAQHVVHLSLSVGNDINWPFGTSILEPIFKTYKQKELLEDSILIYRVQRAPERRIFYIDVGTMPPERAKRHIEMIKNDIHQRRIPNRTGTGGSILDAAYNPLSINDDYFFAQCLRLNTQIPLLDGRILPLSQLIVEYEEGKNNFVYSQNRETNELEAGEIKWAGITRKNATMVRVTLDNNEYVDVTPDHRFILRDGSEIEAENLKPYDSLMPLYLLKGRTGPRQKNAGYIRYVSNTKGSKTKFVHSTICPKPVGRNWVVHHKDFDSNNNNPDNLVVMTQKDHEALHKAVGTYSLTKQWNDPIAREKLMYNETNKDTKRCKDEIGLCSVDDGTLNKIVETAGYKSWGDFKQNHYRNHKVVSIEVLPFVEDTGDITIETQSGSHIFAINAGIYIHNSSDGRGSKVETLPGGECLALNTKIPLLDGRTLPLQEIIEEFKQGKQLWAYSMNPTTGEFVPGMINWAGITRKNTQVVKLTFDNGGSCIVTPDHHFPVQGRDGKIEAQHLNIGDSMFPFEKNDIKFSRASKKYTQFFDNKSKKWIRTHRMVAEYHKKGLSQELILNDDVSFEENKTLVHHLDFDALNNNPENLSWVGWKDHALYHSRLGKWNYTNKTEEEKTKHIVQSIENLRNSNATDRQIWLLQNDPKWREKVLISRAKGISEAFTEDRKELYGDKMHDRWLEGKYEKNVIAQTLIFDDEIFTAICSLIGSDTSTLMSLVRKINNSEVIDLIRIKNKNTEARNISIETFKIASRHVLIMLGERGLDWKSFRKQNLTTKLRKSRNFSTNLDMFKFITNYFNNGITTTDAMIASLNNNEKFIEIVKSLNPKTHHLSQNDRIAREQLLTILQDNGYESWKHLKQEKARFNHKLVSIEWLDEPQDTGTITIDGLEIYHDYHTFVIELLPNVGIIGFNSLGEITDLMFFSKKLARGLRVPTSYLNLGEDESGGNVTFNDGKLGAAMIQEFRFTKYCMRWQSLLAPAFDKEFKRFIIKNGFELDWSLFELQFRPPQSFTKYRQIELDSQRVQIYQGVSENRRLAERFKLTHYLGLTEDEMIENERMWAEENKDKIKKKTGGGDEQASAGLADVGVRPMDDGGMGMDMDMPSEGDVPGGEEPPGGQGQAMGGGGQIPAGATPPGGGGGMPQ